MVYFELTILRLAVTMYKQYRMVDMSRLAGS